MKFIHFFLFIFLFFHENAFSHVRARDLSIPFNGVSGIYNSITDVPGVEVGYTTLIRGKNVRTGVTAVHPRGKKNRSPVQASWFSANGNGEMTGTTYLDETGILDGPVTITNTHNVGTVRDAVISWLVRNAAPNEELEALPVVAETWDGFLNDIAGLHVRKKDVWRALDTASGGPIAEGNVGGGTGMVAFEFKGGTGTASRVVKIGNGEYVLGTLVQANFGLRNQLKIAGVPVGDFLRDDLLWSKETGSIIAVIGTNAPLLPHQLKRIAKRATHGIARLGAVSGNGSGDIFLAFSTANNLKQEGVQDLRALRDQDIDSLFEATAQTVEEAVINSMIAAETMVGVDNRKVTAIPHEKLTKLLIQFNRIKKTTH